MPPIRPISHMPSLASFAQALPTPSGNELMSWLACAALIAFCLNLVLSIINKARGKSSPTTVTNEPLIVQESVRTVTERDCLTRHDQSTVQIQALSAQMIELRNLRTQDARDASISREKLYAAIKDVRLEATTMHDSIRKDLTRGFADIERAIGRLEGKIT